MLKRSIESVRLATSLYILQLLGRDVLGDIPRTEVDTTDLLGHDTMVETPVRITTFAGVGRLFPTLATSMILSTFTTVFLLSSIPLSAQFEQSVSIPSRFDVALTPLESRVQRMQDAQHRFDVSSSSELLTSAEQRRAQRIERASSLDNMHPAAEDQADSLINKPLFERADNKQGVYLTASSVSRGDFFDTTVDSLLAASGSAIVIDVKGGSVLFHSAAPMANELSLVRPLYELPEIIKKLHDRNIYVIGRFVAIKDHGFTEKMPETKIRDPQTNRVLSETWVDPANETAIEYNMQILCELAASGIDEINLDYIRFSTAEFGALGVYSAEEKADRVEKFIMAARETIHRCGKMTRLGLSTYAILGWAYDINVATLGQDVVRFAPLVDIISPMAYPATFTSAGYYIPGKNPGPRNYYLVYRTLTGYAELLGEENSKKLRPWIQGYSVSTKDVSDQIRAVYDAGFCGFTVWNAGNNYAPAYAAMKGDSLKPEKCR